MKFRRGDLIADKYRVIDRLGEGGMGAVLLANHELLGRPVAVKVMHASAEDPSQRERFLREGRIMAQVTSPHAVRLNDVGQLPSGQLFLVMERLEGKDLSTTIEREGPMPIPAAVDVILQTLDALAEAHSLGIVHRDLKPANIFLTRDSNGRTFAKVLDFGISKTMKEEVALTSTGAVMGSPLYMAPEQVRSAKSAHVETDIWALGVVLYEALAGHAPFNGNTAGEVFAVILDAQMPPLQQARPDVPPGLVQVIARCLAKKTSDRFASCGELAQALAPFGTGNCNVNVSRAVGYAPQSGAFAATVGLGSGPLPAAPISAGTLPLNAMVSGTQSAANVSTQQNWTGSNTAPQKSPLTAVIITAVVTAALVLGGVGVYLIRLSRTAHEHEHDYKFGDIPSAVASTPPPTPSASAMPSATAVTSATAPIPSAEPSATASAAVAAPRQPALPFTQPKRPTGKKLGDTSPTRD